MIKSNKSVIHFIRKGKNNQRALIKQEHGND